LGAVTEKIPEDAAAEAKRRQKLPPAGTVVQLTATADGHDAYTRGQIETRAPVPLLARQISDGATLGQLGHHAAVAALGTADRVWVKTIVDDSDAHHRHPTAAAGCRRSTEIARMQHNSFSQLIDTARGVTSK